MYLFSTPYIDEVILIMFYWSTYFSLYYFIAILVIVQDVDNVYFFFSGWIVDTHRACAISTLALVFVAVSQMSLLWCMVCGGYCSLHIKFFLYYCCS
jgi:hypothetical protein